jgi:hypothetical protein
MSNRATRRKNGERGPLVGRVLKHRNDAEAPATAPAFTFRWPRGASESARPPGAYDALLKGIEVHTEIERQRFLYDIETKIPPDTMLLRQYIHDAEAVVRTAEIIGRPDLDADRLRVWRASGAYAVSAVPSIHRTVKVPIPGVDWAEQRQQWNADNLCARQACTNTLGKRYGVYQDDNALKYCVTCARLLQECQRTDVIVFVVAEE